MSVFKRNIFYNTLLSVSQVLFPLLTFPYSSRILGPAGMGAVNFADNFTTYFLLVAALGIPLYGVREVAKVKDDPEKLSKVFSELLFIHLATSLVAVLILFGLSHSIGRLHSDLALYQIGMSVVLGSVFIAEWFFQGTEQFKYIAIRSVGIRVFTIALLFLLVHTPSDKEIFYGLNLITVILAAAANMYAIRKMVSLTFKGLSFKRHMRPLFIIFSNSVVTTIYLVFDTIILGFLTSDQYVGYYSASMRISKLSLAVIGALSAVLLPRLTMAFQSKNFDEAGMLLNKSMNFVVFLSVPIAFGTLCVSKEIILLFAGDQYLPAVASLQALCFIVVLVGIAQVFSHQILLPLHLEKKILYASIIGVVVSLGLNFTLIPMFKHVGAAISSVATEGIVTVILFFFVRKAIKFSFPMVQFLQSAVTCALFFVVKYFVLQITENAALVVLLTVSFSIFTYLICQIFLWKNKHILEILSGFRFFGFLGGGKI
jgi:O-antigen/teichoic acid export membrane protein